jgi:hypothetical protein
MVADWAERVAAFQLLDQNLPVAGTKCMEVAAQADTAAKAAMVITFLAMIMAQGPAEQAVVVDM